jgi:signal transduction histidine kinase
MIMKIFKFQSSRIKNIIGRSFIFSSVLTLAIALVGSVYFNNSGLQILRKNNLQREQQLLSNFLVPAITIADMMEVRRLLSLASDANEKFAVVDNSGNILMPNYDDFNLVKSSYLYKSTLPDCSAVKTGYQIIKGNKIWINCSSLTMNDVDKKRTVGILISFSPYPSLWFSSLVFYFFGVAVISLLLNAIWFRRVLHTRLLNPLTALGDGIIEVARFPLNSSFCLDCIENLPYEVNEIKDAFQRVLTHLQAEYQQRTESEKKSALLDMSVRVAHDLRSFIAVMEMNLHVIAQDISKDKIVMMQMALQSVRDITNNMLEQYRDSQQKKILLGSASSSDDDLNISRPILLYSLIEQIASHKRYEWLQKSCELTFTYMPIAKCVWINMVPGEVKRMISNLLNNAIEACENYAKIQVQLNRVNHSLELRITDNGIGIPTENIEHCLSGESSKHAGRGFGLSGAKHYMETIGGKLALTSQPNMGTTVTLTFSIDSNPVWYPDQICLSQNDYVIILDDDVAMQTLWFHRLQSYPVKIHLFTKYGEVLHWIKQHHDFLDKMILLVDYELAEIAVNGLTLLKYFNIKHRGYLVTSHAEEVNIQNEAEKMGIWLIPKKLASETLIGLQLS